MQSNDFRAKQFIPFDALKGFKEELRKREEILVPKKELTEDEIGLLNLSLAKLKKKMMINITYFDNGKYLSLEGIVTKLSLELKYLYIVDKKIEFKDILELNILKEEL